MADLKKEFWDRIEDVQAGMLGMESDGKLVPMSPNLRKERDGKIWFIAANGEDLVAQASATPQKARFVVADAKNGLYSNVEGTLTQVNDQAIVDELWNAVAAAWFEDGKQDADIRLLAFEPRLAACWFTNTNPLRFLYEIGKANVTGDEPDVGQQADLTF